MTRVKLFLLLVCCAPGACLEIAAQNIIGDISNLEKAFRSQPSDYNNYQNLYFLLCNRYALLSFDQRNHLRNMLSTYSAFSKIQLNPSNERGDQITIHGVVTDKNSKPVAGVKVVIFQADARGYYAPQDSASKKMSEPDSRLYGVLRTDHLGQYEITTIRPASYPTKYEGRTIPQHIHFNLSAEGHPDLKVQLPFDDDPSMKDKHWRDWANENKFPIVKLLLVNGKKSGTINFVLENR